MKNCKHPCVKHTNILLYLLFGAGTTLVNVLTFLLCEQLFGTTLYLVSNAVAWFLAVSFAYLTNKRFVFESRSWKPAVLLREIPTFLGARILSFLLEETGLFLLVELLVWKTLSWTFGPFTVTGTLLAKILLAGIVVILNYFFSKCVVFKKKKP